MQKKTEDQIQVGDELGPYEYVVTPEMVQKMTGAIEEPNPWYLKSSPFGGPIAPPTITGNDYIEVFATKYERGRPIHTKAEHEFLNPIRIGKRLTVRGKIADKYERKGRDYIVIESVTKDEDGVEIVRSRNHLMLSMKKKEEK